MTANPETDLRDAVARGETPWTSYAASPPPEAGVYQWRVPSRAVPGLVITFVAEHRERWAGYEAVVSPAFDHWNGYRVSVPEGTEWRPTTEPNPKLSRYSCTEIEGSDRDACPFCRNTPAVTGNSPWIGAGPHEWREWYLRCCGMVRASTFSDPRQAVENWNNHLRSYRALAAEADLAKARADLERVTAENTAGYLFHNPDTGTEWSESHPVESGEVDDATDIRPATARVLKDEMLEAWGAAEELRQEQESALRRALVAEAEATRLRALLVDAVEALRPFCFGDPTLEHILFGDMPDDAACALTVKLRDTRRARAALAALDKAPTPNP